METAREREYARHRDLPGVLPHSDLEVGEIEKFYKMDESVKTLLKAALLPILQGVHHPHGACRCSHAVSGFAR